MSAVPGGMIGVAASAALTGVLTGPPTAAVVRGAGRVASYLDVDRQVVVVETAVGAGLPNAVRLGPNRSAVRARPGDVVVIGHRVLRGPGWQLVVRRWWDPQVMVGRVDAGALATAAEHLGATLLLRREGFGPRLPGRTRLADLGNTTQALAEAVKTGKYHRIGAASRALLGRGPGLTPAGDDVLAGLLAALRVLGPGLTALATVRAATVADAVAAAVSAAAAHTTALSAQLLAFADHGAVAQPVAAVLRAIPRGEGLPSAIVDLSGVGHTSGFDLLHGIAIAVDAMLSFGRTVPALAEEQTA